MTSKPGEIRSFPVRGRSDAIVAGSQSRRFAARAGMSSRRASELAIVVSELATNIVKHGVRGEITLTFDPAVPPGGEILITARDVGPPIHDLELAMTDGFDDRGPIDPAHVLRRGGLGTGLGAIARLADRLNVQAEEGGKIITAHFLVR
ncbi:MAG TPA: ATP-binding protein [Thermoanaerobaculia bacterium]|nr:ATP-binding protein [Thermoanaerobaculia bacterium]